MQGARCEHRARAKRGGAPWAALPSAVGERDAGVHDAGERVAGEHGAGTCSPAERAAGEREAVERGAGEGDGAHSRCPANAAWCVSRAGARGQRDAGRASVRVACARRDAGART